MPYLIFLLVCVAWSISFLLMKKAGLAFSPTAIAAWRVIAGGAVVGLLWLWKGRASTLQRRDWPVLLVVSILACACPYFIQPWVIARHGSAFMAMMVSFVPLLTMLVSLPCSVCGLRFGKRSA